MSESKIHVIKIDDFLTPYESGIKPFYSSQNVDRSTFTGLLVHSTAVSRGFVHRQIGYLEWLRTKQRFGYVGSFRNLIHAGGWRCLSDEEQQYILKHFEAIPKHEQVRQHYILEDGSLDATQLLDRFQKDIRSIAFKNLGRSIINRLQQSLSVPLGTLGETGIIQLVTKEIQH